MANQRKFEEMLEKLIAEDKAGAEELFHEIVVEKSRDIYESILEAEVDDQEVDESAPDDGTRAGQKTDSGEDEGEAGDATGGKRTGEKGKKMPVGKPTPKKDAEKVKEDEEVDESDDDDLEEDFDLDEFEVEADPMMGGDAADAMIGDAEPDMDMDMDDMGDDGGEEEIEDRVEDLEDALDELKAEFEAMMADHGGDDESDDMGDDDMGDDEADDDMGDDEAEDDEEMESYAFEADKAKDGKQKHPGDKKVADADADKGAKSEAEQMREYVEKVSAKMGDNGANAKSVVAGPNDMGGDASNLAQGGEESGMKAGGAKEDNMGNVNVPGGKAAKSMSKNAKGHGAEKKGAGESGADTKPVIGG